MQPLLNTAVQAARLAGNHIMRHYDRVHELKVEQKQRNDFVSKVDREAEALIINAVRERYPDHAFLGEEGGEITSTYNRDGVNWIIDPLDGTTNFLHQFPQFCVSIGVEVKGVVEHGVVYNPFSQELFTASKGRGATLDNKRIRVRKTDGLEGALLGTGFPTRSYDDMSAYLAMLGKVMAQTAGIRRAGAAALDLAFVACGRLDGFWEIGLKPWDMAAGLLLVKEAGGLTGELFGGADPMKTGHVLAGAPKTYLELGTLVRREIKPPTG